MHERIRELLDRSRVVVYIAPTASVRETTEIMDRHSVGSVLIMDASDKLCGIFTERDLLTRVVARGIDPEQTPISEVMTPDVVVVDATTPVEDVFNLMNQQRCRHIPIADGDRILGVVSLRDLLQRDRTMKAMEISHMRTYFLDAPYPS